MGVITVRGLSFWRGVAVVRGFSGDLGERLDEQPVGRGHRRVTVLAALG
ncbi:MAG TPA: hypothetical protein VK357_17320 [Rubrobacteraceae bacterium]|nr:hypothetical protein [Rubrobacteraceae bacterium]